MVASRSVGSLEWFASIDSALNHHRILACLVPAVGSSGHRIDVEGLYLPHILVFIFGRLWSCMFGLEHTVLQQRTLLSIRGPVIVGVLRGGPSRPSRGHATLYGRPVWLGGPQIPPWALRSMHRLPWTVCTLVQRPSAIGVAVE